MSVLTLLSADLRATVDHGRTRGPRFWTTVIGKAVVAPQVHAVILFRLASALARTPLRPLSFVLRALAVVWSGAEIHPDARIGRAFVLVHSVGVVINGAVEIGEDCRVNQGVTLGEPGRGGKASRWGVPVVGRHVTLGAHAVLLGPITVGDGAVVGANAVVTRDVPPGAIVAGSPARVVGRVEPEREVDFEAALRAHRSRTTAGRTGSASRPGRHGFLR